MSISCVHFEKSSGHAERHNFRTEENEPSYLLPERFRKQNEFVLFRDARESFDEELKKLGHKRGKRPKYENSKWECTININENHSLEDVGKAVEKIAEIMHIEPCSVAIHRDEGHVQTDKSGKEFAVYNYHAHAVFQTFKDGKQQIRRENVKDRLREVQTAVAQVLGMKRGQENSQKVHLKPHEFRQTAQQIEQLQSENQALKSEVLTLKEQKKIIEEERKRYKEEGGHKAEDYRQLQALNKQTFTQEELDKRLAELRAEFQESHNRTITALQEQFRDDKNKLSSEIEVKSEENEELQKQNQSLSLKIEKLETQLAKKPKEIVKTETVVREPNQSEIEKIVLDADDSLIEQHRHFKNTREKLRSDANVLTVESLRAQHKDDVAEIDKLRDANRKLVLSRKSSYTQRLEIIKSATEEELKANPVYQRLQTRLNNLIKTAKTGFVKILKVFGLSAGDEDYLMHSADTSYVANKAVEAVENNVNTKRLQEEHTQHRSFHR